MVAALDVAALVSNMTLAEKESLLSGIGWGPDDYIPGLGGILVICPPFPDTTPPRSSCRTRGQGFLFLFSEGPLLFVDFKI